MAVMGLGCPTGALLAGGDADDVMAALLFSLVMTTVTLPVAVFILRRLQKRDQDGDRPLR